MIRAVRPIAAWLMPLLVIGTASAQIPGPTQGRTPPARSAPASKSGVIDVIRVEGNQRIEDGTIRSYLLVQPGDRFEAIRPGYQIVRDQMAAPRRWRSPTTRSR